MGEPYFREFLHILRESAVVWRREHCTGPLRDYAIRAFFHLPGYSSTESTS